MKGYLIPYGYVGFVNGRKMLFATVDEYYEYMEEMKNDEGTVL